MDFAPLILFAALISAITFIFSLSTFKKFYKWDIKHAIISSLGFALLIPILVVDLLIIFEFDPDYYKDIIELFFGFNLLLSPIIIISLLIILLNYRHYKNNK